MKYDILGSPRFWLVARRNDAGAIQLWNRQIAMWIDLASLEYRGTRYRTWKGANDCLTRLMRRQAGNAPTTQRELFEPTGLTD